MSFWLFSYFDSRLAIYGVYLFLFLCVYLSSLVSSLNLSKFLSKYQMVKAIFELSFQSGLVGLAPLSLPLIGYFDFLPLSKTKLLLTISLVFIFGYNFVGKN